MKISVLLLSAAFRCQAFQTTPLFSFSVAVRRSRTLTYSSSLDSEGNDEIEETDENEILWIEEGSKKNESSVEESKTAATTPSLETDDNEIPWIEEGSKKNESSVEERKTAATTEIPWIEEGSKMNGSSVEESKAGSSVEESKAAATTPSSPTPTFTTPAPSPPSPSPPSPSTLPSSPSTATDEKSIEDNILFLQSLGAITGRGEFANPTQHMSADTVVSMLEKNNPTSKPTQSDKIYGRWELVYCSTQLFRSSPFFMAGRAVCKTDQERDRYNWFCDMHRKALAISSIRSVRQIVTRTNRLVSEFDVSAGSIPFLSDFTPFRYSGGWPVTVDGALVSSADWTPTADGNAFSLYVDTVQVKGSNIPGLRQLLDSGLQLESRGLANVLEEVIPSYATPRPVFQTTYLDDRLRISRDQDNNIFCYIKTSGDDEVTGYEDQESDLGLGKLLDGLKKVMLNE
jgi:hypothetical protein